MDTKDSVQPHQGTVRDHEILGEKADLSHEEAMHFGELTPEELVHEKKLLRKIDTLIVGDAIPWREYSTDVVYNRCRWCCWCT